MVFVKIYLDIKNLLLTPIFKDYIRLQNAMPSVKISCIKT